MGGLVAWFIIGYILVRTKGHWSEMFVFASMAIFFWWLLRVLAGVILAIIGLGLLTFLFTR